MPSSPKVSVIMSVYNGRQHLEEAVESVLGQTLADLEFIVIDDGSTDDSGAWLERRAAADPRLRFVRQENAGLTRTLNRAIEMARSDCIARMDADDVCRPRRLEAQFNYLQAHPEIALTGAWYAFIDENSRELSQHRPPTAVDVVASELCFRNTICHPSVMFRRAAVQAVGGYDAEFRYAQDYDLWTRLVMNGAKINSMPECLMLYRVSGDKISVKKRAQQDQYAWQIGGRYVAWVLQRPVDKEIIGEMQTLFGQERLHSPETWRQGLALIEELRALFEKRGSPEAAAEIRRIVALGYLASARRNARVWPRQSLALLRRSLALAPALARDKRAPVTVALSMAGAALSLGRSPMVPAGPPRA